MWQINEISRIGAGSRIFAGPLAVAPKKNAGCGLRSRVPAVQKMIPAMSLCLAALNPAAGKHIGELLANLFFVESLNHSLPIDSVPAGRDFLTLRSSIRDTDKEAFELRTIGESGQNIKNIKSSPARLANLHVVAEAFQTSNIRFIAVWLPDIANSSQPRWPSWRRR